MHAAYGNPAGIRSGTMRSLRQVAALLLVPVALAAGCGGSNKKSGTTKTSTTAAGGPPQLSTAFGSMAHLPGVLTPPPPRAPNTAHLRARLKAIALPPLAAAGQ